MSPTMIIVIVVVVVVVLGLVAFLVQSQKRRHLRERFGPEYDRAVEDSSSYVRPSASWRTASGGTRSSTSARCPTKRASSTGRGGRGSRSSSSTSPARRSPRPTGC